MFPTAKMVEAKRKAVESLYQDTAFVTTVISGNPDPNTGRIVQTKRTSGPFSCRLSYRSFPETGKAEGIAGYVQSVKLFCAPEIEIPAGSDIVVNHLGKDIQFTASGVPAVYTDHQEINLSLKEKHNG